METIFFILIEAIYYLFLSFLVTKFNSSYLANSCIWLFLFSMLISIPSLICIKFIKNTKKYFVVSSVLIIFSSLLILLFRQFTKNGIINFTFYLYSILFMLVPFLSFFMLSLHKLSIPKQKKKQLFLLIASKKVIILVFTYIFSFILKFQNIIILISVLDFVFNISSPFISNVFRDTSKKPV